MIPEGITYNRRRNDTIIKIKTKNSFGFVLFLFAIIWSSASVYMIYGDQYIEKTFNPLKSIFGLPFILGSLYMFYFALNLIFGKTSIIFNRSEIKLKKGLLGRKKSFRWKEVNGIAVQSKTINNRMISQIYLKGIDKNHYFGYLEPATHKFVIDKLKSAEELYGLKR